MANMEIMQSEYRENFCELRLMFGKKQLSEAIDGCDNCDPQIEQKLSIRNCDVYIDDYHLLIFVDVRLYKFKSTRCFDVNNLKNVILKYKTGDNLLLIQIPCQSMQEPESNAESAPQSDGNGSVEIIPTVGKSKIPTKPLHLWKLKCITEICYIQIDDNVELLKPEQNFKYGFASKFKGKLRSFECDLNSIVRVGEPYLLSPLRRTIDREIDEMKNFCREQYKLNFVELQIPEGHDSPMDFTINFRDIKTSREEQCLLHNLLCKSEFMELPEEYNQMEIDCGLISILLAICYDVRCTQNEPTCESAWTRNMLTSVFSYYECFKSLRDVVIDFYRRTLIYPLYRNFELGRKCVDDCITALQYHSEWILKQLLITHSLFNAGNRSIFNHYFLDDYICYISNPTICSLSHMQMLSYNLKNVKFDIAKPHVGLGLNEIESEVIKEVITDIHIVHSEDESEDDDDTDSEAEDAGTESCESEYFITSGSSSDTEENSVIEKRFNAMKL